VYLGIEIGGTKLQLGVGAGDASLAGLWRGSVDVAAGAAGIRRQILAAVPELLQTSNLDRSELRGIGIGFGGPVDDATRSVIKSHQIQGWDGFPLADWIADMLDLPAVLGNDADCAGLAEALFGAGKGLSPIFYITIGSGIGGGLIINGEIYRGCGRGAAEIGHLQLISPWDADGPFAYPLEKRASGWAIAESAKTASLNHPDAKQSSLLRFADSDGSLVHAPITAWEVAEAAKQGDRYARFILTEAWELLADAICQVITLLCPRRIVIGGGVSLMGEKLLFCPLREMVAERVFEPFSDCYDIVPAALGEEVVVHGAVALARKRLGAV
jgi:glucokinase